MTTELNLKNEVMIANNIDTELKHMKAARLGIHAAMLERATILRVKLPSMDDVLKGMEADHLVDVVNRVDEKSKPLYSNAEARKAAVEVELLGDPGYQSLLENKRQLQLKADELEASIQSDERLFSAAKLSAQHKTAIVQLMGGDVA